MPRGLYHAGLVEPGDFVPARLRRDIEPSWLAVFVAGRTDVNVEITSRVDLALRVEDNRRMWADGLMRHRVGNIGPNDRASAKGCRLGHVGIMQRLGRLISDSRRPLEWSRKAAR